MIPPYPGCVLHLVGVGFGHEGVREKLFEDANRAIWDSYRRAETRHAGRRRYPALIQAIDELLFELEELNLSGVDRVPSELREKTSIVLSLVPSSTEAEEIRVRYRVNAMIDTLFRAQELVFRAKDPGRVVEVDDDDREWTA